MSDTLTVTFANEESRLELLFTPDEERTFDLVARIHQRTVELTFSSYCCGYDLAEFTRELESFHARYEGAARFINQTGDIQIELSLVHPGRGIIGVVATLEHWVPWPADYAPVRQQAERRSLVFQGFTMEQSYLPSLVTQIREFIAETGISTIHPMIHETSA
ncbi:MAG: hypothetical protein QOF48_384 [Verrucomicrobiota bacterium]|jgi:hypothetical protein